MGVALFSALRVDRRCRHAILAALLSVLAWSRSSLPMRFARCTSRLGGLAVTAKAGRAALSRVTLRWHGGAQAIATRDGYFLASVPVVASPPFRLLPFDLVATNDTGRAVATYRIPTSFLYLDWKHIEPKLRAYRKAHGCSKRPPIWHCRSR